MALCEVKILKRKGQCKWLAFLRLIFLFFLAITTYYITRDKVAFSNKWMHSQLDYPSLAGKILKNSFITRKRENFIPNYFVVEKRKTSHHASERYLPLPLFDMVQWKGQKIEEEQKNKMIWSRMTKKEPAVAAN